MVRSNPRHAALAERKDSYRRPVDGLAGRMACEAERRRELDLMRVERRLTDAEQAEHDRLIGRLYMRQYRQALREQEAALS